jgi:hypothetical protein
MALRPGVSDKPNDNYRVGRRGAGRTATICRTLTINANSNNVVVVSDSYPPVSARRLVASWPCYGNSFPPSTRSDETLPVFKSRTSIFWKSTRPGW